MSAGLLRRAAERIREVANAATPGPWSQTGIGDYGWTVSAPTRALVETEDSEQGRTDADWIAAMHPGVGLALADWLEHEAEIARTAHLWTEREPCGWCGEPASHHALAVARAVLGEDPS